MALLNCCDSFGALYDAKRANKACRDLGLQWIKLNKQPERPIDETYKFILEGLYRNANTYESQKRERENSYELQSENSGRPVYRIYNGESGSENACEPERKRKTVIWNGRQFDQSPCPSNNRVQREHVVQARSGNKDRLQDQRKLSKVLKRKNVIKEDHAMVPLSDSITNKTTKNIMDQVDEARSSKKDKVQSKRNLEKLVKEKTVVKRDHEAKRIKRFDRLVRYDKVNSEKNLEKLVKKKAVVKRDHEAKRIEQVDKASRLVRYDKVSSRIFLPKHVKEETVVKRDHGAMRIKRADKVTRLVIYDKVNSKKKSPKSVKEENVVNDEANTEVVVPRAKEYRFKNVDHVQPGKKVKVKNPVNYKKAVKGKNVVDGDDEKKPVIQIENEYLHQKAPDPRKSIDQARSGTKGTVERQRKSKRVVEVENVLSDRNDIHRKSRNVCAAECSKRRKENKYEDNEENKIDDEVQFLESAKFFEEADLRSFVPSTIYKDSNLFSPNVRSEYRERVLDVLRKPFDKEEYKMHTEAVKDGSYDKFNPDLKQKLTKYRYNQKKRMTIFRGFFFWIQNLTNIEAFKPWNDQECLAVLPGSA